MSEVVFQIKNFLSAYDKKLIREALKMLLLEEHEESKKRAEELERQMKEQGWEDYGIVSNPELDERFKDKVWFATPDGRIIARPRKPAARHVEAVSRNRKEEAPRTLRCPVCGTIAYAQSVCSKCAKGKAGIKKMWICGENADHVFYTEK